MSRRISVRAILLFEGKLLCVQHRTYAGSLQETSDDGYWCLPGGGLNEGEALHAGLEREMIEETGIMPTIGNLLYVQQFPDGERDFLEFFFHVTNSEDYLHIDLSHTSHGQAEIAKIDFIDPTKMLVLPKFLATEPLAEFAISAAPTRIFSYPA